MKKSPIKMMVRAFKKQTAHWIGHPQGFKSKREWKEWCRNMAHGWDWPVDEIQCQGDADEVAADELYYMAN